MFKKDLPPCHIELDKIRGGPGIGRWWHYKDSLLKVKIKHDKTK